MNYDKNYMTDCIYAIDMGKVIEIRARFESNYENIYININYIYITQRKKVSCVLMKCALSDMLENSVELELLYVKKQVDF